MKLTLETSVLKELVAKAKVGASCDRLISITELMLIKAANNEVTFVTTDATNYLYVSADCAAEEEFYAVIYAEQFNKLIPKLTSRQVTLEVNNGAFTIHADGTYQIEMPIDGDGESVIYPDPAADVSADFDGEVDSSVFKLIESGIGSALAKTETRPVLQYYYAGDNVIGSDGCVISEFREKLFAGEKMLISPKLMTLLNILSGDIGYIITDKYAVFADNTCTIYANFVEDVEDYYVEKTMRFLRTKFPDNCKANKERLISAIDRIALFINKLDNNAMRLTIADGVIEVANVNSNSAESVETSEFKSGAKYTCKVNASIIIDQLKSYEGEVVTINYGLDNMIALTGTNTTQVISLMV